MNLKMLLCVEAIVRMKHEPDDLDNNSAIAMELYDRLNTIKEIEILAQVMISECPISQSVSHQLRSKPQLICL
jgi:hypothetical protein